MRLRANTTQTALTVTVARSRVLDNVLEIYRGDPDLTLILNVQFKGERGHDLGGLTEFFFSVFGSKLYKLLQWGKFMHTLPLSFKSPLGKKHISSNW